MTTSRSSRGGAILLMAIVFMGAVMALSLLFFEIYHAALHTSRRQCATALADLAAQAALREAVAQLRIDREWKAGFDRAPLASGATYSMSFEPSRPPWATNNATGNVPVTGWEGRAVMEGKVHLVATGTSGTVTVTRQGFVSFGKNEQEGWRATLYSRW